MITFMISVVLFVPLSFIAYVVSERANATHQARVGKGISFVGFSIQHAMDALNGMKSRKSAILILISLLQYSGLVLFDLPIPSVLLIYLMTNALALVLLNLFEASQESEGVITAKRIESDRIQIQFIFGSVLAFISSYASFSFSGTQVLPEVSLNLVAMPFLVFFQIAGMILYGEHPFTYLDYPRGWAGSARFYLWSLLSAKLFLGGSWFVFDLHIKAAILFVVFRLFAIYFPKYQQKDVLKIGMFYLIPLSVALWLLVYSLGVANV